MNQHRKMKRGFTLIELLVVIAIIGILASVVLTSLNSGRGRAQDAKIKSALAQLRNETEIMHSDAGCYSTSPAGCASVGVDSACELLDVWSSNSVIGLGGTGAGTIFESQTIRELIQSAIDASGTGGTAGGPVFGGGGTGPNAICRSTMGQTAWAVAVPLNSDTSKYWCVNSSGAVGESQSPDTDAACLAM